jgi:hypothetical protein
MNGRWKLWLIVGGPVIALIIGWWLSARSG